MSNDHSIYTTQLPDGSFLAVSLDSPRFGVTGSTSLAAKEKALEALEYYDTALKEVENKRPKTPKVTTVIRPIFEKSKL
jgi:hypothetical protein